METATATSNRELTISRVLNAPRKLVWKVWTEPDHIKNWWGPNGFTNTIFKMNVQPGGEWDFIMHGPDGTDYKNKSIYKEIVKHERIVYEHISGPKFLATVTFEEEGEKTLLKIRMLFETAEERENVVKVFKADVGLKQNIYKLEGYLKKIAAEKEMSLTRIINAPREMVFKAWTDPAQLVKWWGPKDFKNRIHEFDATPGGRLHIDMLAPDGMVYPMDGEFHEIVELERLVFTGAALDKNGNRLFEVLNTVIFTEENGKTKLEMHAAISNIRPEGRQHVDGMNEGWNQSFYRLNELVSTSSKTNEAPFIIERTFNAPVEKVWNAITDKDQMKQWYFDVPDFKPRVGYEFQFYAGDEKKQWLHLCKVTEVDPGKKITYSWRYDGYGGNSFVSFELLPQGNKTTLKLTHAGLESFPGDTVPELKKENFAEGWNQIIGKSLKEFLE
jgi:uncharacterized protein YndB with AHSA1/START domain